MTLSGLVIVDHKDLGGEVRLLIDGHTFILHGRVVRGLRELAKSKHKQLTDAGYSTEWTR